MQEFISLYGVQIMTTIGVAIVGYLGSKIKQASDQFVEQNKALVDNQITKDIVATCVKSVDQLYTELHGEEKKHQAMIYATKILWEHGIEISEQELGLMVESIVKELNNSLK